MSDEWKEERVVAIRNSIDYSIVADNMLEIADFTVEKHEFKSGRSLASEVRERANSRINDALVATNRSAEGAPPEAPGGDVQDRTGGARRGGGRELTGFAVTMGLEPPPGGSDRVSDVRSRRHAQCRDRRRRRRTEENVVMANVRHQTGAAAAIGLPWRPVDRRGASATVSVDAVAYTEEAIAPGVTMAIRLRGDVEAPRRFIRHSLVSRPGDGPAAPSSLSAATKVERS